MEGIWRKLSGRNRYHKLSTDEENTAVQRTDPTTTAAISADFENADDVIEDHQISSWSAFWNVCNSIQGVAILAMPYVIKGGGIWSILSIVVVAAISNYTGQILIKCHYDDVIDEDRGDSVRMRTRFELMNIFHLPFFISRFYAFFSQTIRTFSHFISKNKFFNHFKIFCQFFCEIPATNKIANINSGYLICVQNNFLTKCK